MLASLIEKPFPLHKTAAFLSSQTYLCDVLDIQNIHPIEFWSS
jgi:hypothetical protein